MTQDDYQLHHFFASPTSPTVHFTSPKDWWTGLWMSLCCKMKTPCQKMLKFCQFLSDLQRNRGQDYKRFSSMSRCSTHNLCSEMTYLRIVYHGEFEICFESSSNLSWICYVWRVNDSPNHFFLVTYWLKLFYLTNRKQYVEIDSVKS